MKKNDARPLKQPVTSSKRLFKLAGASASIASKWVKSSASNMFRDHEAKELARKQMYLEIGKELAEALGEMKGAVMKVGQILSQMKDFLPEEVSQALGALREHSVSMDFETVKIQIQKSLGADPSALFQAFETTPYRAASLGQVHRARLKNGQEVVVKVQYPGVREACQSDLKQLRRMLRLMGVVNIEKHRLDAIFDKIHQLILGELDFRREAEQLVRFGQFHEGHEYVVIPKVIDALSCDEVLTMTFEPGHSLIDLQENVAHTEENQALRNTIARNLYQLFAEEILHFNATHLDPHAGNFAYREDGKIVMYDFGAVAEFEPEVIEAFKSILDAAFKEDYELLDNKLVQRGLKRTSTMLEKEFYQGWVDIVKAPFGDELFDFGQSNLHVRSINKLKAEWRIHISHFAPMPDSILLDRLIIGHYWNLVRLGANLNLKPLLDTYVFDVEKQSV